MAVVNVVVTCTNGKSTTVPPPHRMRNTAGRTISSRAARWIRQFRDSKTPAMRAADLYVGQHWRTACSIANAASGKGRAKLWVCSAGYGLLPFGAELRPYSATFSEDNPDCVSRWRNGMSLSVARREWWTSLSKWKPFRGNTPRTLAGLASAAANSPLLVITSPKYLDAMADDLIAAAANLKNPDYLVIVCAGASRSGPLRDHLLPCDDRLQSLVGGSKWALNARIGKKILDESNRWPVRMSVLSERYDHLLRRLKSPARIQRVKLTDAQVKAFMRKSLREEPHASHSPQLREFREAGFACEQGRFRRLFKAVKRKARRR